MTQKAMLCPRCRQLIGSEESVCSWCGAQRSSAWWRPTAWVRGGFDGAWLVKAVITVTIVIYAFSLILGMGSGNAAGLLGFLSPDQTSLLLLGASGTVPIDRYHWYWTVLTANYLHGGILHLVFNLMALRQIAPWVTQEYGPSRMFVIYTLGGVCGYLVSYVAGVPFTIGASGAICSLIGSLLYYGRSRGGTYGAMVFREVSGWVFGLVLFGFLMPGINNWAHGGGIIGGIVLGLLLGYEERTEENAVHRLLALLCAGATVAMLGWRIFLLVALGIGH
ncbi:rhomboid family intramembrane serine protease [Geobacter sp. FeAm09]|uniref:rhomboid family intramembrane serine protease n=1 Tax=Geobacter sp. FeAm09 TaxID=2597769 RepID=UPI0011ED4ECB|nr:rhomboid family intramembrane serine protease [Geobacter sp. FeAm09]QEM68530.1 rhomboid family intramembrane serine protease [Geobacter sp. FeAm09]